MCVLGREASPKDGVVGDYHDISAEHDFHARNAESAESYITGALSREKLCFRLFGGGDVTSATIVREIV